MLTFSEARGHPHSTARRAFVDNGDVAQPAPAPRFSRTPAAICGVPPERGVQGREALADWGFSPTEIDELGTLGLGYAR